MLNHFNLLFLFCSAVVHNLYALCLYMYIYMIIYTQAKLCQIVTVWSYLVLEEGGVQVCNEFNDKAKPKLY